MLKLVDVSKRYDESVFEGCNYTFNNGIYQLVGANGSGKSTLLKCICGLEKYQGTILINNQENLQREEILSTYVSYASQELSLFTEKTVQENFDLILEADNKYLNKLIENFEFEYCLDKKLSVLSSGEQKLTQFIIGISQNKPILILDEIDNYLDDISKSKVTEIIKKYDGIVIFTSHTNLIDSAIIVELENMNSISNIKFDTVKAEKVKNNLSNIKVTKSKYSLLFAVVIFIFTFAVGYGIERKAEQYHNGLAYDIKQFYDDTALLIYPPYTNPNQYEYQTTEWYEKTPYLLPESLLEELKQLPYVEEAEGVRDPSTSTSYFIHDGIKYHTNGMGYMSSLPYDIASHLNVNKILVEYIEGDIPKDDAFEALASESFMTENNLQIGDKVNIEEIDEDGNSKLFEYTIVGIEHMRRGSELILSYQTINAYPDLHNPNTEIGRETIVEEVQDNSLSPIKLSDIDSADKYYPAIYVKADNVEDTKKLIKYIQDYDPYIGIESNFQYSTSLTSRYEKEKDIKLFTKLITIYLILVLLVGGILIKLEIKRLSENILPPLRNYGFTNMQILGIYKSATNKYLIIVGISVILMLLLLVMYKILLAALMFAGAFISLLLITILVKVISKKEIYETRS